MKEIIPAAAIVLFGIFVIIFAYIGAGYVTDGDPYANQAKAAIEECEAELPRNKNCIAVISAGVRDE